MKRSFLHIPLALLLALVGVGCDSDGDDRPDAERILGTWIAERVSVLIESGLPRPASVPIVEDDSEASVSVSFESGAAFTFRAEGPIEVTAVGQVIELLADGETLTTRGTYALEESDEQLRFTITTVDGQPASGTAEVGYDFRSGGDDLALSGDSPEEARALIAFLTGSDELAGLVSGFESSFERAGR